MRTNFRSMMVACIAAMTLTSACNKQDVEQSAGNQGVRSFATANISTADTRISYDDQGSVLEIGWEPGDTFTAYNANSSFSLAVYTATGSGKQAAFEGTWQEEPQQGDVLHAAYIGNTLWVALDYRDIPVEFTGQTGLLSDLKQKNFMYARASYNRQGTTQFTFIHRIAVIKLQLTFPEGVSGDATYVGLKATGLSKAADFDLVGGGNYNDKVMGDVNTGEHPIAIDPTTRTLTAYLCVLPDALSGVRVTATVNGENYEASVSDKNALNMGKMYTVRKEMVKVPQFTFTTKVPDHNKTYLLPVKKTTKHPSTGSYTLTVKWGDGETTIIPPHTSLTASIQHTYAAGGTYPITIISSELDYAKVQMPPFDAKSSDDLISLDSPLLNMDEPELNSILSLTPNLVSIPAGLFDHNPAVANFDFCFSGCHALSEIPSGLFDKHTVATSFQGTFEECSSLKSVPEGLFANNMAVTSFSLCFSKCSMLVLNSNIFCDEANQRGTRFSAAPQVDFTKCFEECGTDSSIPLQGGGVAPTLWNYTYGGGFIAEKCYLRANKVANVADIPEDWKGRP